MKNFADQGKAESKMTVSSLFQNNSLQAQKILTSLPSSHVQNTCFFLRVSGCEGMFSLAYMLWFNFILGSNFILFCFGYCNV